MKPNLKSGMGVFYKYLSEVLQGINISHLGKRKIIFKMPFFGDMLVSWRVILSGVSLYKTRQTLWTSTRNSPRPMKPEVCMHQGSNRNSCSTNVVTTYLGIFRWVKYLGKIDVTKQPWFINVPFHRQTAVVYIKWVSYGLRRSSIWCPHISSLD